MYYIVFIQVLSSIHVLTPHLFSIFFLCIYGVMAAMEHHSRDMNAVLFWMYAENADVVTHRADMFTYTVADGGA